MKSPLQKIKACDCLLLDARKEKQSTYSRGPVYENLSSVNTMKTNTIHGTFVYKI